MGCRCCKGEQSKKQPIQNNVQIQNASVLNPIQIKEPIKIEQPQKQIKHSIIEQIPSRREEEWKLDIRVVNLLDRQSTISIEPPDIINKEHDVQIFEKKMEEILSKSTFFYKNKGFIEEELNKFINQDKIELIDQSQNTDFRGPLIQNRNICDIINKYDFSSVKEFTEYNGAITLVRLIQKQKSPICTFVGQIEQQYCCVKLIPMANIVHIKQWIEKVKNIQSKKNYMFLNQKCQKYYYYKIETIDKEPETCNCYIISKLEQYNVYTFSRHPALTFAEKLSIASDVIQIISLVLQDKTEKNQSENLTSLIFGNMMTVKRNNILISRLEKNEQNTLFKVVLSDWQLLLPEFEVIIPNQKLQNQDELYKKTKQQIEDILSLSSNTLALQNCSNIQDQDANQLQRELFKKRNELDQFTKQILKLILLRVNYDLDDNLNLIGFFNKNEFKDKCYILNNIENNQQLAIKQQIQNNQNINPNQVEIIRQISKQMCNLFQLSDLAISEIIYEIYLKVELLPCERSRAILSEYNQTILAEQIRG